VSIVSATATGGHDGGFDVSVGTRPRGRRVPGRLLRLASDERLVEALRGGSEAAFEVLYTRHHRGVLSFCRHMLGSVEEAEDALQHTFLAAYRDLVRSTKPIRLRPWLYTIARNRCLTVLRARRERVADEPLEPATEHLSHEVERRDDLRALLGDLAGLPPDQRAALVLAELGDMSHDDIGDVLGCPRDKVKALVFQARSSLIVSRTARETPCEEIRQQLANLRGGSLRRNTLRHHLRDCAGCREFRDQVRAQRSALALVLPVAPTLGLKATVLGAAGVTAAATGAGSASVVATTVVALCVAGGGTAAVDIARDDDGSRPAARAPRSARAVPAAAAPKAPAVPDVTRAVAAEPERLSTPDRDGAAKRRNRAARRRGAAVAPAVATRPDEKKPKRAKKAKKLKAEPGTGNGSKPAPVRGPDRVHPARGPKPHKAKPDKARAVAPRAAKPAASKPRGSKPEKVKPAASKPRASKPAASKPEKVKPEKADEGGEPAAPVVAPAEPKADKPPKEPKPDKPRERG
jgi:RNA polymerase sigma factor (sigma-70 family)